MSESNDLTAYLADHPKMTGALFTLVLLLSQGMVFTAAVGVGNPGP